MTVDLEEEQDPPSFKTARKKDKERLQKVISFYYRVALRIFKCLFDLKIDTFFPSFNFR